MADLPLCVLIWVFSIGACISTLSKVYDCGVDTIAMQAQKALFSAAEVGSVEVMQVALSYNCDVNAKLTDKVRHKALGQAL